MKTLNYFLAGALLMTACVEKFDTTAPEQNDSEKWEAEFGKVDPNQTWNMATKANLSISAKYAGTIEVFTKNPIEKGCMLLMRKQVEAGTHELQFDVPQGMDKVFVQVSNSYGPYVTGYLPLDGTTAVAKAANAPAATRTDDCHAKVAAEKVTINYNTYYDPTVPPYGAQVTPAPDTFMVLEGVKTTESPALKMTDFYPICGTDGVYNEGKNNIEKWVKGENAKLQPNVTYTFAKNSELTLNLIYTGTIYANKFGIAIIDPNNPTRAAARKYIVTTVQESDIRIEVEEYYTQESYGPQKHGGYKVKGNCANALGNLKYNTADAPYMYVYGKTYHIPYVDANGNTSYTFPKGTQIAFFNWAVSNDEVTPRRNNYVNFSMESWNDDIHNLYNNGSYPSATTFRYGKNTYVGFEDDTDQDINDLLFLVNGDFTEKAPQLDPNADPDPEEPTPVKKMTWTLAFEDQISDNKSDFDFNDVVIRVAYAAGEETAEITYCAAGGTLQSELFFNEKSLGEIHAKFDDPERKALINTYSKIDKEFVTEELTVPADFSLSSNASQFKIKVTYWNGEKESCLPNAAAYGSTPHGFCVPGNWAWPRECLNIKQAYPQFEGWAQNASANQNWYEQVNASAVISE